MKTALSILLALIAVAAAGRTFWNVESKRTRAADDVASLTGARTRVAWCRQVAGPGDDSMARGTNLVLMGLDSGDGRGERRLLPNAGSYWKPLLTPRGDRVVFTDWTTRRMHVVNWSGTSRADLGAGAALDVWLDDARGIEWVYALDAASINAKDNGSPLIRFPLDNPSHRETVWDQAPVTLDTVMVAHDGRSFGGLFPWPNAGIADLAANTLQPLGRGCWTALAPDASRLLWVFDGAHRNVVMHTPDNSRHWTVNINGAPGVGGYEVYHPRWSNHARFFGMTGPYKCGSGDNQIRQGGPGVEIYVGRFDAELTRVEAWARLTENTQADFYPSVWVDPSAHVPGARHDGLATSAAPAPPARLVLDAELTDITPAPSPTSIAPYVHALVVYRYAVLNVVTGQIDGSSIRVAHWGVRDAKILPTQARRGDHVRLNVEPFDSHPELEGERMVMSASTQDGPLYYDVGVRQ